MEPTPPPPPPPGAPGRSASAIPPPAPRNWWQRNWKWFVPTGCLTIFLVVVAFVACIAFIAFTAIKSTDVYKTAVARAKADPDVRHALGSKLHTGMFPTGKTSADGSSGQAELSIPISGSKGKGTIYVVASKSAGEWQFSKLIVKTKDGDTIDLLQSADSDTDEETIDEDDDDDTT